MGQGQGDLEICTSKPLRRILRCGIGAGIFQPIDAHLVACDLLLAATLRR